MSVPTRLRVSHLDEEVLIAIGTHLGSLAGGDLALLGGPPGHPGEGRLPPCPQTGAHRKVSSRWAGAITRTSEDAWSLAERNLGAEVKSLRSRINRINRRLAIPVGQRQGATSGYPTRAERFQHQQRLQVLCCRLRVAEAALASGEMSICRGGRRLARARHNLEQAGLTEESWTKRWEASRMFLTADGEAGKAWGNETIRFNPDAGSLEIKLPSQLSHLANAPHGRYRLTCDVSFSYRADDVAAQAASGAVRYDITLDPDKARWYLRAAWKTPPMTAKTLEELQGQQVLGVDLNPAHLAAVALDASGNPLGGPVTIPP
jgi:hypothetical protein